MATLGHVAVGMAAARTAAPADASRPRLALDMVALSLLAMAPDLDVVAFALGIPYRATWGHRGAFHSLVVSGALGAVVGASMKSLAGSRVRSALLGTAVAASHGLLDIFTDGGLGMALLWPFTGHRYFAPWRPIPVAPIGAGMLSPRGMRVLVTELLYFAPLFVIALGPRRWRRARLQVS